MLVPDSSVLRVLRLLDASPRLTQREMARELGVSLGAFWEVANYREAYSLFACSGILFNHESPLRPERFATSKIVRAALRIAAGSREKLQLGNISIRRDWGWAPEYVEAMWRMLQQQSPHDFVVATGHSSSLEEFVDAAFSTLGLDWHQHVTIDEELFRPTDLEMSLADPVKATLRLGWTAECRMVDVVRLMLSAAEAVAK